MEGETSVLVRRRRRKKETPRREKILMPVMANEPIILNVYDMVSRKTIVDHALSVLIILYQPTLKGRHSF